MRSRRPRRLLDQILLGIIALLSAAIALVVVVDHWPRQEPSIVSGAARPLVAVATPPPTPRPRGASSAATPTLGVADTPVPAPPEPTLTITPVPLGAAEGSGPLAAPPAIVEVPLGAPAPILMYHYIRSVDPNVDPLGYELSVDPALFAQHMEWLHANGYTGIRMDKAQACLSGAALCPPKPVVLTFDDGYQDAYDAALPVLQRYGFTATFYVVSNFVNQPGYMNWGELIALHEAGMEIGSHTIDHPDLTSLDYFEAERQIAQSKADLERGLGFPIVSFCYPTGKYHDGIIAMVAAAGYQSATTTRWDSDYSNTFALPRRRIAGGTDVGSFGWIVQS